MNYANRVLSALKQVFTEYPAALAFVLSTVVAVAAHFGWHTDAQSLTAIWVVLNGFLLAYVHSSVSSTSRLKRQGIEYKPVVKDGE